MTLLACCVRFNEHGLHGLHGYDFGDADRAWETRVMTLLA